MKTILIISPEPWNGHFVSKHHYAITLAKHGYRVYFLDPPNSNLKDIQIEKTKYENLFSIKASQVAKGLRFYPKFLRVYIEKRWLENLENKIGQRFSTIWLFENSRFYNMEFAEDRLKIYHQVDLNQDFHVKEASESADICFGTNDFIINKIKKYNTNTYKIHHGYNELTSLNIDNLYIKSIQNKFSNTINIVYIGNMDIKYLDFDLLNTLVNRYKNLNFHFIGGYSDNNEFFKKTKNLKNVIWWRRVESRYIISFLQNADVCLLVYRADKYKEQLASPHKILEYLASGKVIVATYTDEYKDKREILEMVSNSNEFIKRFDEVVNNLEVYNSKDMQEKRIFFAKNNTYEKQFERIKSLIKKHNLKGL